MVNEELAIASRRDLSPVYEAFSEEDDEDGNPVFVYSSFGFITKDYSAYFGQSDLRKYDLTLEDIRQSLKRLPDDDVYPSAPSNVSIATTVGGNVFVKGPKLHLSFIGTGLLPKLTLQEVSVMELLLSNPHPHLARYHGCLIERGRIVGIVLDRYPTTLRYRFEDGTRSFGVESCMRKITSAVSHLHSLGLAHNDLTPMNVMLNEFDDPFIIDYGSCQPLGATLITGGTPGWTDDDFTTSAQEHDHSALEKIRRWLHESVEAAQD